MTDILYKTWLPTYPAWYDDYVNNQLSNAFVTWCNTNGVRLKKMYLDYGFMLPNEEVHALFKLQWGWPSDDAIQSSISRTHGALYRPIGSYHGFDENQNTYLEFTTSSC